MNEKKETFLKLERLGEYFTYATVLAGLLIIQLPFPFPINRVAVEAIAIATAIFSLIWHRFTPKEFTGETKNFIEAVIDVFAISGVVHFTGGINSYFVFLYFLPALNVAANMSLSFVLSFIGIAYGLILIQGFADADAGGGVGALSIAAFHLFALGLVSGYGRFLSFEVALAKKKEEQTKVEQIEEVSNLKDEFVFIISHELRSPITAIRGYLELLLDSSKNIEALNTILNKAFYTANKLANLVGLLLEVSRLETGKIKFYMQKVKIKTAVDDTLKGISTDAQSKHISLVVDVPEEYEVISDVERIIEILTILIENAIRYTPEYGKVHISATRSLSGVSIEVSDTGIGIDPEIKKHLFEKFYSLGTGNDKEVKNGLGLYVTKALLDQMQGEIEVKSEANKGTTFKINFPTISY
jgi:signal transduction histidine kinase